MPPMIQASRIFEDADTPSKPSVLRAMMPAKTHKPNQPAVDGLRGRHLMENHAQNAQPNQSLDQPHGVSHRPLNERPHNMDGTFSPERPHKIPTKSEDGRPTLHKKTKSSVSLKSLLKDKDKKSDSSTAMSPNDSLDHPQPKKSKSSTSLSALLTKRSTRGKKGDNKDMKDKENTTPPNSAGASCPTRSPIWEQFATQSLEDHQGKLHMPPAHRGRAIAEEIRLYTPNDQSANFKLQERHPATFETPTMHKRPELKPRPKSDHISSRASVFTEGLDSDARGRVLPRIRSKERGPSMSRGVENDTRRRDRSRPPSSEQQLNAEQKRSSRVLAAASEKSKEQEQSPQQSPQDIENDFEALLDSRNIPHNMRDKMRSLDTNIKADFIKKNRVGSGSSSASGSSFAGIGKMRPSSRSPTKLENRPPTRGEDSGKEEKRSRSRPRSRAFTLTKRDSSQSKKQKSDSSSRGRPKSVDMSRPGSATSLTPSSSQQGTPTNAKPDSTASPVEFIHYLREVQKPEIVEIGKMHKLRILLRNETVAWVDLFISKGGMDEVVGLLHRIIKVEWREEHEDTLLHETLLCLKALCTTSLALQNLTKIEDSLFPTLLNMLFDEEKKGPSEFTTRGIIISLLFAHLSSATGVSLQSRAEKILSYLRDPAPPNDRKPLDFVQGIYQPRPYRIWCKEVVNVTKEVFWIFLHHLNIVPIVPKPGVTDGAHSDSSFAKTHFPPPRPPVPAAPYVGGVEWDATNYLAAHLDLMNGLIASLPTREERDQLRCELRASGFEKAMGGSLRTCKEKFYGAVHEGLRTWVASAVADGWPEKDVREGPPKEACSPKKSGSPVKKKKEEVPKLELDVGIGGGLEKKTEEEGGWL